MQLVMRTLNVSLLKACERRNGTCHGDTNLVSIDERANGSGRLSGGQELCLFLEGSD